MVIATVPIRDGAMNVSDSRPKRLTSGVDTGPEISVVHGISSHGR